uniref:Peptidase S1 domain-containing protein n=1 Tax=Anopheles minimus TaxID=112268 RepID=A0A182VQH5_9DIPT
MFVPGQATPRAFCQVTLISEWYAVGPAHCFANDGMDHTQICAVAVPANYTGPCERMLSGSPLQTIQTFGRRERYFLQGVLSFGARECDATVPEIYTNVAVYLDWILYNMRDIRRSGSNTNDRLIFTS